VLVPVMPLATVLAPSPPGPVLMSHDRFRARRGVPSQRYAATPACPRDPSESPLGRAAEGRAKPRTPHTGSSHTVSIAGLQQARRSWVVSNQHDIPLGSSGTACGRAPRAGSK